MLYVLKFNRPCPELMTENFYDEVVTVRNGIALVVREHVKNALLGMGYGSVGTVEDANGVNDLINGIESNKKSAELSLGIEKHTIKIEDLLQLEQTHEPEQAKSYLENLE